MIDGKIEGGFTPSFSWNFEKNHASVGFGWTVFGQSVALRRTD
jgi:hypothetical protein